MTYVFDIDGTICTLTSGSYENAEPIPKRIEQINELHSGGNAVIFFTARGMGRSNNNMHFAYHNFFALTRKQLSDWGVKYDQLLMGKPAGDIYIDDKGIKDEDFFTDDPR